MTNQFIKDKQIVIIGGGPGGLPLARLLQMRGGNVKVYERDADRYFRITGSSLDLHKDSGQLLIEAAGLAEEFKKASGPEDEQHRIYDKHGNLILDLPAYKVSSERPEIDRPVLRNLLLNSLLPETVLWNKHFVSLNTLNDKYELNFKDKEKIIADIIAGSDGANSKIRPYVTDIKPQYSGTTLIQGDI